ncbi:helix-turn-helix domain-containing protein [Tichowtungia aerotolerans]|uniref:helix-turn-helix domain-containing protein n=1 Tax=Tichowtungia aerotolerans TaxID=2697043 RepID=UPI0038CD4D10
MHLEHCKRAFLLIRNDRLSVKEAAERTGFCDAYHFSKVFKKTYGFPPGLITRFFKPQS